MTRTLTDRKTDIEVDKMEGERYTKWRTERDRKRETQEAGETGE